MTLIYVEIIIKFIVKKILERKWNHNIAFIL